MKPLVKVLCLVDGEQTPIWPFYEAMDRVKEAVRNQYRENNLKYEHIWEIIDRRWSNQLHQRIYVAGYFLNPCFCFSPLYGGLKWEVIEGFSECMQRMAPAIKVRDLIVDGMEVYQNAKGKLFSLDVVKRGKNTQTLGTIK